MKNDMELITRKELAELLKVTAKSTYKYENEGILPKPIVISRSVKRWRKADILRFLQNPEQLELPLEGEA